MRKFDMKNYFDITSLYKYSGPFNFVVTEKRMRCRKKDLSDLKAEKVEKKDYEKI